MLRVLRGLPVVDPNAEREGVVDPSFRVVVFAGNGLASRQAVGALMLLGGDCTILQSKRRMAAIQRFTAAFRPLCEHEARGGAGEAVEFDLRLGVALFARVPGDGPQTRVVLLLVCCSLEDLLNL